MTNRVIPALLSSFEPAAKPVLLHGDLWSGNIATADEDATKPVIYDCSAYYGHHEADFGISRMFGREVLHRLAALIANVQMQPLIKLSTTSITQSGQSRPHIMKKDNSYTSCTIISTTT